MQRSWNNQSNRKKGEKKESVFSYCYKTNYYKMYWLTTTTMYYLIISMGQKSRNSMAQLDFLLGFSQDWNQGVSQGHGSHPGLEVLFPRLLVVVRIHFLLTFSTWLPSSLGQPCHVKSFSYFDSLWLCLLPLHFKAHAICCPHLNNPE